MKLKLRWGLVTDSWELKLTALGLALLLWAAVRSEDTTRFTMRDVPVDVRLTDNAWVTADTVRPATVDVDFRGPVRELIRLAFARATLVVPVEDVDDTLQLYRPRAEWLEYDRRFDNLLVERIEPDVLRMRFEPVERRIVPVVVRLDGPLASGTRLAAPPSTEPANVLIEGRRSRVQRIDSVVAHVTDVEAALREGSARASLDTAGLGVSVEPHDVLVRMQTLPDSVLRPLLGGATRR